MASALAPTGLKLVVPCRNCAPWVVDCLKSVLAQDYTDWSLLVADDASTDDTEQAVAPFLNDPRIRYRTLPERGWLMGNTWDALGLVAPAPTDVVAIVDGDDELLPGALSRIMQEHATGFDVVYTDMVIDNETGSTGSELISGVPIRQQLWCLSQLRTFKGYLLDGLKREMFLGEDETFLRAAGDLALYFPLIERAGMQKTSFIPEKLYRYRVHENCNFKILRSEQLRNNHHLRACPALPPQHRYFDFHEHVDHVEKLELRALGHEIRQRHPQPYSVCVHHHIPPDQEDSWRAYHGLWIDEGIFLQEEIDDDRG